ncbi:MAG: DUF368 domain-containing protein [Gammaproteobacteria bacterium]|nr:DUF368 domain-containing protein [Gammaproteobacteria bacterium]
MNPISIIWRGFFIGIVEVLPGISGGTVALLTRIYDRLVNALADIGSLGKLRREPAKTRHAVIFICWLALGMLVGFATALFVVLGFVQSRPLLFWGAIFGLVIGAIVHLSQDASRRELIRFGPLGLAVGLLLVVLPEWSSEPPLWLFVIGGFCAFVAWLLPGISGSMVLLLTGLWIPMLEAVQSIEILKIALFAAGLVIALVIFPKLIARGVKQYRGELQGFFIGLVTSTLYKTWPWRDGGVPDLPANLLDWQTLWVVVCATISCGALIVLIRMVEVRAL